jgi:hypothetical protein
MLQELAPELWVADHHLKLMGAEFGARMTIIRLGSGGLLVHSPITLSPALQAQIAALGPVEAVVAPNSMHHMYLPGFVQCFPMALAYGAEGVARKQPDVQFTGVLAEQPEFLWAKEVDQHRIAGQPKINEVAFLHRPTRTLLLTDWLFNFNRSDTWWTRTFLTLAGAWHGPAQSRLLRLSIADKAAARASRDHILGWDFDRIIVAHGDIIHSDGKAVLRKATAWLGA